MLSIERACLVVVDVQGSLFEAMYGKEALAAGLRKLVSGAKALGVPILVTEQNPSKLGPTIEPVRELLPDAEAIPKMAFSCAGEQAFMDELAALTRRYVILAGIEAHVCIYQTARDLAALGFKPEVVADAVSSRTDENRRIGIERAKEAGARITSVETVLFELMGSADHPAFREILKIVK